MISKEKELTGFLKELHKKAETGVRNKSPGKNCRDPLIDEKTCQAPHLADLMTSTYLPEQMKDIHELKVGFISFIKKVCLQNNSNHFRSNYFLFILFNHLLNPNNRFSTIRLMDLRRERTLPKPKFCLTNLF